MWENRTWIYQDSFQNEIIDFISGGETQATGDAPDPSLFNTAADGTSQTWVYIMHPCYDVGRPCPARSSDRTARYPDELQRMVSAIRERIPGLAMNHIIAYYYRPFRGGAKDIDYTEAFQGRALFQFDPTGIDGVDDRPDWRLLYEGAVISGRPVMGDLDVSS